MEQFYLCTLKRCQIENKPLILKRMEQSYIFDFCTLFDMEQDKDIRSYQQQSNNTLKAKV